LFQEFFVSGGDHAGMFERLRGLAVHTVAKFSNRLHIASCRSIQKLVRYVINALEVSLTLPTTDGAFNRVTPWTALLFPAWIA
jgi:hypothetical protein